jgi:DNA-binding transcriptional LysR family regulator
MADRLEAMSMLLAVTDAGSFSAASRRLGVPLATISRKIADLERHLNARLINRSSRRLTLTDAGDAYVAACRRILEEVDEAERAASGEYRSPRGNLVITAPIVFGRLHVLPVTVEFLKAYPEIDIRLVLADRVLDFLAERVDVAVRLGALPDSSLIARRVAKIRRVVCGSPAYLAARGVPESPQDLGSHDCITFESLVSPAAWSFASGPSEIVARVRSRLSVNTAEAAIDAAIAGMGITRVLSYQIADAVAAGLLEVVLEGFEPAAWPVSLVYAGEGLLPLKVRAFLDFAAPRLKTRLTEKAVSAVAKGAAPE